jgi:betaine reductase
MSEENPGVDLYRESLHIIDSGSNPAKMREVLSKMAGLGKKLAQKTVIGSPAEEGYLRRGLLRDQVVEQTAARRLVDMLLAKLNGKPFESEMLPVAFEPIPMPAAIKDLSQARVMLITDGGLVPKGNPDRIQGTAATRWGAYNIAGRDDLRGEEYEISHGGYDARFVQEDPDRLVPLDAMREMEKRGVIGKLHDEFISTSGRVNPLSNTRRLGREMAQKVKREGVDAVILTST